MDLPPLEVALAEELRAEALGMAEAYLGALLDVLPGGAIAGVYLKGSACRSWDSAIDYVPELSDVDIHVRLSSEAGALVRSFDVALEVARLAIDAYSRAFPEPRHVPRPQLSFLGSLERLEGYLPSPSASVRTLYGRTYEGGTEAAYSGSVPSDAERFMADATFVREELAGKVIDRPGRLLWSVVSRLTFRVSPAGPRLLTQLGASPYHVWTLNRTAIVDELNTSGHGALGAHYADFYRAGWEGYRSGFSDGPAARRALAAAHKLFEEGHAAVASIAGGRDV